MKQVFVVLFLFGCGTELDVRNTKTIAVKEVSKELWVNAIPNDTPPVDKIVYTESFYADVTPSDKLEIIFLIDNDKSLADVRAKLKSTIADTLHHIINSNWSVAVTTLQAKQYPAQLATKYENAFDYDDLYAKAVEELKEEKSAGKEEKDTIRAFIIVTNKDLELETRETLDKVIGDDHINLVYGLLNTKDNKNFIGWKRTDDEPVLNRYGNIELEDYREMMQEISADISLSLRSNFWLKGYKDLDDVMQIFDRDYIDIRASSDPDRKIEHGHVAEDIYSITAQRRVFIDAYLPEGMCFDMDYTVFGVD